MAIPVDKTKKQLEVIAEELGIGRYVIPTGKDGKYMKEDYIVPIRKFYLAKRYQKPENVPLHMRMMLKLKSPMLARRIDDAGIPEEIIKAVWESDEWYLEEKLNGARMLLVNDGSGDGIQIYSRHNSDVDLLPINYTEKILFPDEFDPEKVGEKFILDTEMTSDVVNLSTLFEGSGVETETQLHAVTALLSSDKDRAIHVQKTADLRLTFNVFDCLFFNDDWIMELPLKERRKMMMQMGKELKGAGFKIKPVRANRDNKAGFHKQIVASGGEGTIAKNINGVYIADTNRPKDGWLKIKRSVSQSSVEEELGMDTIDGWISGFEPATEGKNREGMVGSILVSVYVDSGEGEPREHVIAKISGIDMKLREDMTEIIDGKPYLKASYYDRVVEIDGASVSARSQRLNHPVFLGFRYDKNKDGCVISEGFLKKMVL